jgi:hypothetical protein
MSTAQVVHINRCHVQFSCSNEQQVSAYLCSEVLSTRHSLLHQLGQYWRAVLLLHVGLPFIPVKLVMAKGHHTFVLILMCSFKRCFPGSEQAH